MVENAYLQRFNLLKKKLFSKETIVFHSSPNPEQFVIQHFYEHLNNLLYNFMLLY